MNRNLCNKQNLTGSGTVPRPFTGHKIICTALILLCLVITSAITGIQPAAAENVTVNTWEALVTALRTDGNNITLGDEISPDDPSAITDDSQRLIVPSEVTVTLDLNGHTIDRGLAEAEAVSDGYVIKVESSGNLTLKDTAGGGIITGGNNTVSGGGVYVNTGTFTMESGKISGNTASSDGGGVLVEDGTFIMEDGTISKNTSQYSGGGVSIHYGSNFSMNGGKISDNTASSGGGGVFISWDGIFTINDGAISGNTAQFGGGVFAYGGGLYTMSGGMISDNIAQYNGGGVSIGSDSLFTMTGGTISGNTTSSDGGGVYSIGTFNISGNPVISENKMGDYDNNVWLANGKNITVAGPLTNTTPIGVTLESGTGTFTSGLGGKGVTVNFRSDAGYAVGIEQNEACLNNETADRTIYFSGENFFLIDSQPGSLNTVVTLYQNINPFSNTFRGWNTLPDGTGAHYKDGGNIILTGDVTLYAQWGNAAKIVNGSEYPTLQDAIDAAGNDDTVKLLTHIDSVELAGSWPLQVGEGKNVTLDLNGFNIDRGLTEAASSGYVIGISGNLTLTDSSQAKTGTVTGGYDNVAGGGVYVDGSTFTMSGGTISGNTADAGGGVYVESGEFIMTGGTISGSTAAVGGGVYVNESCTFTMNGGTISGNRTENVDSGSGGGVYVNSGGTFNMIGGTISGNYSGHGGGVDLIGAVFNMSGGSITQNTASQYGGGVSVSNYSITGGNFIMSGDAVITGNKAGGTQPDQGGGGVFVNIYSQFTMNGGTVSSNDAIYGGGIFVKGRSYDNTYGTFTMNGGAVARNTANVGSGVYMYDNGQMSMTDGTISGNAASRSSGGIHVNSNSKFTMTGGTITQNTASQTGGGVYLYYNGTMNISGDPVISGNRLSGGSANNLFLGGPGSSSAVISVTGDLTNTLPIGITMANPDVFTSGLSGKGTAANFRSDSELVYEVRLTDDSEAELRLKLYNVSVTSPAHGAVTASPEQAGGDGTRTVTLTVAPEQNYVLKPDGLKVSYTDESGTHDVALTKGSDVHSVTGAGKWTFTMPTADVTVSAEFISTWTWLQMQLDSADSGSVIRLDRNIIWTEGDPAPLTLGRSGVELTLDLNGFTINRGLAEAEAVNDGSVIRIGAGTLTLKDSRASGDDPGTGLITGGKTSYYGGGVYVGEGGSFILESGTISGCTAAYGGSGVYVMGNGQFTMKGGTVSANSTTHSSGRGGGVYVDNGGSIILESGTVSGCTAAIGGGVYVSQGTFTMKGGLITGGKSSYYGGGVCVDKGSLTMKGGTVIGNTAERDGGGVYVSQGSFTMENGTVTGNNVVSGNGGGVYVAGSSFTMEGGTVTGNTADMHGGGVCVNNNSSINLSGSPVITGNTAEGGAAGNVYLYSNAFITVTGPLTGADASVGVTMSHGSGPFTDTGTDHLSFNDPLKFFSDNSAYTAGRNASGQLYLGLPVTITGVTAVPRAYEAGSLTVALTGGTISSGVIEGDDVSVDLSDAKGTMADADIGTDKPVTVSGVMLGGADAGKYVVSAQPSGLTVTISGDGAAPSGNAALRLPSGLKEVQASAFEGSPSFNEVYLPDGMETIGGRAFADCSGLKLVHIPDSVTSIADDAFAGSLHVIISCTSGSIGASYARDYYIMRQDP